MGHGNSKQPETAEVKPSEAPQPLTPPEAPKKERRTLAVSLGSYFARVWDPISRGMSLQRAVVGKLADPYSSPGLPKLLYANSAVSAKNASYSFRPILKSIDDEEITEHLGPLMRAIIEGAVDEMATEKEAEKEKPTRIIFGLPITLQGEIVGDTKAWYGISGDRLNPSNSNLDDDHPATQRYKKFANFLVDSAILNLSEFSILLLPSALAYAKTSSNHNACLVVDIGDTETRLIPVVYGEVFWPGICFLANGADSVVQGVKDWVPSEIQLNKRRHRGQIENMIFEGDNQKGASTFYVQPTRQPEQDPLLVSTYASINGGDISAVRVDRHSRYAVAETLFAPRNGTGLGEFVANSLMFISSLRRSPYTSSSDSPDEIAASSEKFAKDLAKNIVLTGTISALDGMNTRLINDITDFSKKYFLSGDINVTVCQPHAETEFLYKLYKQDTSLLDRLEKLQDGKVPLVLID